MGPGRLWGPLCASKQLATYQQGVYKSSPTDFQDTFLKSSRRFLRDKPYNIKMQAKSIASTKEHAMMSPDQRSSLCHRLLIYEQQTRGLPYVQCIN